MRSSLTQKNWGMKDRISKNSKVGITHILRHHRRYAEIQIAASKNQHLTGPLMQAVCYIDMFQMGNGSMGEKKTTTKTKTGVKGVRQM